MLLYDSLMSWSKSYLPLSGGVIGGCIVRVTFPGCTLMLSLGNKSNAPSMVSGTTGSDNSSASIKAISFGSTEISERLTAQNM